jgi:hypothetical protein
MYIYRESKNILAQSMLLLKGIEVPRNGVDVHFCHLGIEMIREKKCQVAYRWGRDSEVSK